MSFSEFLLGPRGFRSANEVVAIAQGSSVDHSGEAFDNPGTLRIFATSKQQTWLVATNKWLYCVLDDVPRGFTRVQWTLPANKLVSNSGAVVAPIHSRNRTERSGSLDIGPRTGWLFSKRLFDEGPVEDSVKELVQSHMTP